MRKRKFVALSQNARALAVPRGMIASCYTLTGLKALNIRLSGFISQANIFELVGVTSRCRHFAV
jgi:hypothetical protein